MWGCCYGCCYLPAAGASPFLPFFPAVILPAFRRLTFFSLSSSMPSSLLPSLVQTQQDAGSLNRCSSMNDIPGDPPSLPPSSIPPKPHLATGVNMGARPTSGSRSSHLRGQQQYHHHQHHHKQQQYQRLHVSSSPAVVRPTSLHACLPCLSFALPLSTRPLSF